MGIDKNTTEAPERTVLGQVGELIFWTLASGIFCTLSLAYAAGWMTSSSAPTIYMCSAILVPLTAARYLRLRARLLGDSKSDWIANVVESLVGVAGLGAMVVFLAALYGAVAADFFGIRSSSFVGMGIGAAVVALSLAGAVWAKRRGWPLVAEDGARMSTISMAFLILMFPVMLGMFGWAGSTAVLMLVERFVGTGGALQQFFSSNTLAGITLGALAVLTLAAAVHTIRRQRASSGQEPSYLQSLWIVGFATVFLHLCIMLLMGISGGMPR